MAASFCLVCSFSATATAQAAKPASVPRVGTIKDYPATGLTVGCGNLYFYKAADAKSTTANYVFLSRGDGSHAWMNLNGRDVRLRQLKSTARGNPNSRRHFYSYGNVRITVDFRDTPEDAVGEGDQRLKMRITLRNGRAVRVIQAVGDSDC